MSAAVTTPGRSADGTAAAPRDVAALIRAASADDHRSAENRGFVTRLMGGELDLAAYTRYLAQFAYVYEALESRPDADPHADPADAAAAYQSASVFDPKLRRFARIQSDLAALGAADWRERYPALPATRDYSSHLRALTASPHALDSTTRYLAHHYARYLGDLSGGQAIAVLLARHYDAAPDQLSFYDFSELGSVVHAKRTYKERLNALELDAASVDALTAEVVLAFRFSAAIFDELSTSADDPPGM